MTASDRTGRIQSHRFAWIPPMAIPERCEDSIHVLLWQVNGTSDFTTGDDTFPVLEGHALWIPVGTRHNFTVRENSVVTAFAFPVVDLATTLSKLTIVSVDEPLSRLMHALHVAQTIDISPPPDLTRQILSIIEGSSPGDTNLPLPSSPEARAVAETILFNPGDVRSVAELAASVHVSPRTIERRFLAETGTTVRQWRIRARMTTAIELLRADTSVAAVAHRVGYTNVTSFRRAFTEHFGESPTCFARRFRSR